VRQAPPDAVQVGDRWHIWHNFAQAAGKEVAVHSGCWATASRVRKLDGGKITTLQRWHQVHDLLDAGVGLLECARRLNLALNTVKRYARIAEPAQMRRAPQHRPTFVDPYREYLRKRRAEDSAVPALQLLGEIRERGYTGSQNLLYRYIIQGRVEDDRPATSPRRLSRLLLSRPDPLRPDQQELLHKTTSARPQMRQLASLVRAFAQFLAPADANGDRLEEWINAAEEANLPHVHSFIRGLRLDQDAVRGTGGSRLYRHFRDRHALMRDVIETRVQGARNSSRGDLTPFVDSNADGTGWSRTRLANGRHGCSLGSLAGESVDQDGYARFCGHLPGHGRPRRSTCAHAGRSDLAQLPHRPARQPITDRLRSLNAYEVAGQTA
jgi:Transposase